MLASFATSTSSPVLYFAVTFIFIPSEFERRIHSLGVVISALPICFFITVTETHSDVSSPVTALTLAVPGSALESRPPAPTVTAVPSTSSVYADDVSIVSRDFSCAGITLPLSNSYLTSAHTVSPRIKSVFGKLNKSLVGCASVSAALNTIPFGYIPAEPPAPFSAATSVSVCVIPASSETERNSTEFVFFAVLL